MSDRREPARIELKSLVSWFQIVDAACAFVERHDNGDLYAEGDAVRLERVAREIRRKIKERQGERERSGE